MRLKGDTIGAYMESISVGSKMRGGHAIPIDEVFQAWTSCDLRRMLNALDCQTHPIDRHFLLMGIVDQTYKLRADSQMAATCRRVAQMHLDEFPAIAPILAQDMGGKLPCVPTFHQYSTLLAEAGEIDRAIQVCEAAIGFGLQDGTKAGYAGRIQRLQKSLPERNASTIRNHVA